MSNDEYQQRQFFDENIILELAKTLNKILDDETKFSYLDKNNILYKYVDGEYIGKESYQTSELKQEWT